MTEQTICLIGWVKVMTWTEGHGNGHDDVYQAERKSYMGGVQLLTVCTRRNQPTSVRVEQSNHDYLLAREIRANPDRYVIAADRVIEACCTAGYDDFRDLQTDDLYRVASVAGHGEWAFPIN